MPALNVCVQIYMNKKNTQNLLKIQTFPFFSEALSKDDWNQGKGREIFEGKHHYEKKGNILINNFNKFRCFFYSLYIYI